MLERLREFLNNLFSGLSRKKGPSVIGIDISSSTIKVVQLRKKGERAVLETYGELALGPYAGVPEGKATSLPVDTVGEALKDLLREAKVTTKSAGISIPMRSSLITVIEMPNLGEKRLKEMVPIEVRKYIPVSINEVMLDWRVIPGKDSFSGGQSAEEQEGGKGQAKSGKEKAKFGKVEILVVAIHKETINRFQEIIKSAGIEPSFFEIEVFSSVRATLDDPIPATMIVDIGAANTKLLVVEGGILRKSHIMNRGSQDITNTLSKSLGIPVEKAEELKKEFGLMPNEGEKEASGVIKLVAEGILNEAHRVLLDFQNKKNVNVAKVILSGGGSLLKGIQNEALRIFQTEVAVAHPFENVETPAFLEETLKSIGPEFAVALGAAIRKLNELE